MPTLPYRVFYSASLDGNLTPDQLAIKYGILDAIHRQGCEPQAIGEMGDNDPDPDQCRGEFADPPLHGE